MKGVIALDIDGTLTDETHQVPNEVAVFLASLVADGWEIVFITGRTFRWVRNALSHLTFPYHLAVQNGAIILKMPQA